MPELVSVEEAARVLGVSVSTVRRRIKSGYLQTEMVDGRLLVSVPYVPHPRPVLLPRVEREQAAEAAARGAGAPAVRAVQPRPRDDDPPTEERQVVAIPEGHAEARLRETDRESPLVEALRARIAELEADRDRWLEESATWRGMAADLSQRLHQLATALLYLSEQRTITARQDESAEPADPLLARLRSGVAGMTRTQAVVLLLAVLLAVAWIVWMLSR